MARREAMDEFHRQANGFYQPVQGPSALRGAGGSTGSGTADIPVAVRAVLAIKKDTHGL